MDTSRNCMTTYVDNNYNYCYLWSANSIYLVLVPTSVNNPEKALSLGKITFLLHTIITKQQ